MEEKTIIRNTAISAAIAIEIAAADAEQRNNKAITMNSLDGMGKETMKEWRTRTAALAAAVGQYITSVQTAHNMDKVSASIAETQAITAVYNALHSVKNFAGYNFPNDSKEHELLAIRLSSTFRAENTVKAADGTEIKYISDVDAVKGEQTCRRLIERFLYDRQHGIIGITADEYAARKEAAKAAKKAERKAREQKRLDAAKKAESAENNPVSESVAIVTAENKNTAAA
jgi:hypothetical protein